MRAIAQDDNEDVWVRRENVEGQPTNEVHNPLRGKKKEIMEAILVKSFSLNLLDAKRNLFLVLQINGI